MEERGAWTAANEGRGKLIIEEIVKIRIKECFSPRPSFAATAPGDDH